MSDLHARLSDRLANYLDDSLGFESMPPLVAALRAVVELHKPFARGPIFVGCRACSVESGASDDRYRELVEWPCSTIQAIARELGVDG